MRKLALTLVPLFLAACNRDLTAPNSTQLSVPSAVAQSASSGAQVFQATFEIPIDWLLTPAEFPCLKEPIHVTGSVTEHDVFVVGGSSSHFTAHQSTQNVTAVGVTSGDRYAFSGPLTFSATAPTDGVSLRELTFHNINHIVGPGKDSDIFFRTLEHITFDPATGEIKTRIFKDAVLC